MIVRILNDKQSTDKLFDCRNSCIRKPCHEHKETEASEFVLDLEFESSEPITVVLASGDAVYYMNDAGNTIHVDRRML